MKKIFTLFLLFISLNINAQNARQKVIFDCDMGDDIDDAFA